MKKHLRLEPSGERIGFHVGSTLREILAEQEIFFAHPCGGQALCGHCLVRFLQNAPAASSAERQMLSEEQLEEGLRLSCRTQPLDGSVITLIGAEQNRFEFALGDSTVQPVTIDSETRKTAVCIQMPTIDNQGAYLECILEQLRLNGVAFETSSPDVSIELLQRIPEVVEANSGKVTVTYNPRSLVQIEAGDQRDELLGIAIDVGTTTVAVRLVDLTRGRLLSQAATLNSQNNHGIDVIHRVEYCAMNEGGAARLRQLIGKDLHELTERVLRAVGREPESVAQLAIVGNPTMTHLLLGVDPGSIARSPYSPCWSRLLRFPAWQLGFDLAPGCEAVVGPSVSGYVGADILAGAVACGLDQTEKLSLLIDVGTNGEMVLGNRDRLLAAASPAGPAFEGAEIHCGMWAAPGAIDRVTIGQSVEIHTLQDEPPIGICGSGLVDVTAELLRAGIVTPTGLMLNRAQLAGLAAERLQDVDGKPAFLLAESEYGPLHLTAGDVRQVQLAKGALEAGTIILMKEMGVRPEDIEQVFLAGAFGQKIQPANLKRIGLLTEIPTSKIRAVGNSALAGAQLMLLSREHLQRMEQLRRQIHYIELSGYPGFMEIFAESMAFPASE